MKQLNIKQHEILEWSPEFTEFALTMKLRAAGFDLSKTIERFDDYANNQIVFRQFLEVKQKNMFELILEYGWSKYWKYRKYWKKKMKGNVCDSFVSFSMFYYPEDIGDIEHCEMQSGKTGVYKVIDVRGIDDWGSKDIKKDFIGYKDVKPIRECTLTEFMELYPTYLK